MTMMATKPTLNATAQLLTPSTPNASAVITAIPTEVPMRWPVCMMPPELPAYCSGTSASVSAWLGLITEPWAMPTKDRLGSSHHSLASPAECNQTTPILSTSPRIALYMPPITTLRP